MKSKSIWIFLSFVSLFYWGCKKENNLDVVARFEGSYLVTGYYTYYSGPNSGRDTILSDTVVITKQSDSTINISGAVTETNLVYDRYPDAVNYSFYSPISSHGGIVVSFLRTDIDSIGVYNFYHNTPSGQDNYYHGREIH